LIMSKIRQRYDDEFRKNAVKLSYVTTKPIKEFCADLGIHHSMNARVILLKTYSPFSRIPLRPLTH
ncbi:MAG: transposase, partial [Firmicutes bacterium]|nr:transposase [Bacillota bacterium]